MPNWNWNRNAIGGGNFVAAGDPFGFAARKQRRRSVALTISIDPGSTQYLFKANYEELSKDFQGVLPEVNLEKEVALHSGLAGTTIQIFLNGLITGSGIVAAELLKEATKELWKALKAGMVTSGSRGRLALLRLWRRPRIRYGDDNIKIVLPFNEIDISADLREIGPGGEDEVRRFVSEALPALAALVSDLISHKGWSGPPFVDETFRTSSHAETVDLIWERGRLRLTSPICLACKHLETNHKAAPCWTCTSYADRPASDKRPHSIGANDKGQFPESEGSHFAQWKPE